MGSQGPGASYSPIFLYHTELPPLVCAIQKCCQSSEPPPQRLSWPPLPGALPLSWRPPQPAHNTVSWLVWFSHTSHMRPLPRVSPLHVAQPLGQWTRPSGPQWKCSPGPYLPARPNRNLGAGPGHLHVSILPSPTVIPSLGVWGLDIPEPAVGRGHTQGSRIHSSAQTKPCRTL